MVVQASAASCWVVGSSTAAAVPLSLSARRGRAAGAARGGRSQGIPRPAAARAGRALHAGHDRGNPRAGAGLRRVRDGSPAAVPLEYAELTEAHNATCDILIDAVAETQRRGAIIEVETAAAVAMTLWCTVHGLATLVIDGHIAPDDVSAEVERSLRIVDHGLLPRAIEGPSAVEVRR